MGIVVAVRGSQDRVAYIQVRYFTNNHYRSSCICSLMNILCFQTILASNDVSLQATYWFIRGKFINSAIQTFH